MFEAASLSPPSAAAASPLGASRDAKRRERTDKALASVRRALAAGPEWALVWNLKNVDHAAADACKAALRAAGATVVTATSDTLPRALGILGIDADGAPLPRTPDALRALIVGPLGPLEVHDLLAPHRAVAPIREGLVAPYDLTLQPGPTGLSPAETAGFASANVATKIQQGQITVCQPATICRQGDRLSASAATFLSKLAGLTYRGRGNSRPGADELEGAPVNSGFVVLPIQIDGAFHRPSRQWVPKPECGAEARLAAVDAIADVVRAAAASALAPEFLEQFRGLLVFSPASPRPPRTPPKGSSEDDDDSILGLFA